jgi:transcriptional regulator with XRE-family HTH domain
MNEFAEVFRQARMKEKRTLREIGEHVNLSIGYLSDVEHGRKNPPDLETVKKIEKFLGVTNGELQSTALRAKRHTHENITSRLRDRPQLRELLLRADSMDDDQLNELIDKTPAF